MHRLLTILFAASLATTTVDAIEIGSFESALASVELTNAQAVMIRAATRSYSRRAKSLAAEKVRLERKQIRWPR
jgi:hypothetical protein